MSAISISLPLSWTRVVNASTARRTVIESANARRSTLSAREEPKISSLRRDRAKLELVEDPIFVFALDEFPVAIRPPPPPPFFHVWVSNVGISIGLRFERCFFGGVPAPETVLVQVHPMSRSSEARIAHKLLVTCQDDLRCTTRLGGRKTDVIHFFGQPRSRTEG